MLRLGDRWPVMDRSAGRTSLEMGSCDARQSGVNGMLRPQNPRRGSRPEAETTRNPPAPQRIQTPADPPPSCRLSMRRRRSSSSLQHRPRQLRAAPRAIGPRPAVHAGATPRAPALGGPDREAQQITSLVPQIHSAHPHRILSPDPNPVLGPPPAPAHSKARTWDEATRTRPVVPRNPTCARGALASYASPTHAHTQNPGMQNSPSARRSAQNVAEPLPSARWGDVMIATSRDMPGSPRWAYNMQHGNGKPCPDAAMAMR